MYPLSRYGWCGSWVKKPCKKKVSRVGGRVVGIGGPEGEGGDFFEEEEEEAKPPTAAFFLHKQSTFTNPAFGAGLPQGPDQ